MLHALVELCSCPTSQLLLLLEAVLWPAEMGALVPLPAILFIFPFLPTPRSLHPWAVLLRGRHRSTQLPLPSGSNHIAGPGPLQTYR